MERSLRNSKRIWTVLISGMRLEANWAKGAGAMSTDNDWWILIGTFFLLTTPATYVPVAKVLGIL